MKGKQLQGCTSVLNSEKDRREHQGGSQPWSPKEDKKVALFESQSIWACIQSEQYHPVKHMYE